MPVSPPDAFSATEPAALRIGLADPAAPPSPDTLAVFDFDTDVRADGGVPLRLQVPLRVPPGASLHSERWQVAAPVHGGRDGAIRHARGGGWMVATLELDEAAHGGIEAASAAAYAALIAFQSAQPERHVLRIWNYFADINAGHGDAERYKLFCAGRRRGMGAGFDGAYPAATAVGHRDPARGLVVYWLACARPGTRIENPRQVPAWRYPRQYGPTPPGFARGVRLPGGALAISGTASIVGHASLHPGDCAAQLRESLANIAALQAAAGLSPGFDPGVPLKAYLRHAADLPTLRAGLPAGVPAQVLLGDICRHELLVEIDGWR